MNPLNIAAGLLIGSSLFIIGSQILSILSVRVRRRRDPEATYFIVPVIGGVLGALGALLSIYPLIVSLWWLPLLLDPGSAFLLVRLASIYTGLIPGIHDSGDQRVPNTPLRKTILVFSSAMTLMILTAVFPPWITTTYGSSGIGFMGIQGRSGEGEASVAFHFIGSDAVRTNLGGLADTSIFWPVWLLEWALIWAAAAWQISRIHQKSLE